MSMQSTQTVRAASFLFLALSLPSLFAASTGTPVSYAWKPNDVLRFEYSKRIQTSEEVSIDEVYNDRPVVLIQRRLELVEFQSRMRQASDKTWKLGMSTVVATCSSGEMLTLTGVVDDDDRRQKWVEVRTDAGVTGYVPGATKVIDTREFSFDTILILEIKNRKESWFGSTQNGTFAVLHFDDPRVVMPESYLFASNADDPALQKDRTKSIVHAIEGAIKLSRWNVVLYKSGLVHIESRVPKSLEDWLKETEHTAFWRSKYKAKDNITKAWVDIVESNLSLAAAGDDREMFLVLDAPAVSFGGGMDAIRPYRGAAELISSQGGKAQFRIRRVGPPHAGEPYTLPYLGSPAVLMTIKPEIKGPFSAGAPHGEDEQIGAAVFDFDSKVGLLDSLSEGYSFETEYKCDEDARRHYHITQKVSVKYNLKRLAPPIATRVEPGMEAPLPAK